MAVWVDPVDVLVERFLTADRAQREATVVVGEMAAVKFSVVSELRGLGMTFAQIGGLVGLKVSGVQRIAYKKNRP